MNGQGSVYRERDRWVAQLSIGPRGQARKVRRTRTSRREALDALVELRAAWRPERSSRLTLSVYLAGWVRDVRNLRPATLRAYGNAIRDHLAPALGGIQLVELTPLDVERALGQIGDRVGPKSLRNIHAVLRRALGQAVRAGLVERNVAAREFVDAPRVPAAEPRALSVAEVRRLLAAAKGDRLEALFVLAVGTGLRQGELLGLAWEDIDLGRDAGEATGAPAKGRPGVIAGEGSTPSPSARLSVRRELVYQGGRYRRDELKTPHSRRAVPLAPSVVAALVAHRQRVIEAGFVPTATGPVFTSPSGGPLSGSWLTHRFYRLADAAGIPRLPFHKLRSTYASRLAEAGVSEVNIARLLGHSRTTVTKQHYIAAGAIPDAVVETVERMVG